MTTLYWKNQLNVALMMDTLTCWQIIHLIHANAQKRQSMMAQNRLPWIWYPIIAVGIPNRRVDNRWP